VPVLQRVKIASLAVHDRAPRFEAGVRFDRTEAVHCAGLPERLPKRAVLDPSRTGLIDLADFIAVKGWKALGNRLTQFRVQAIKPIAIMVGEDGE